MCEELLIARGSGAIGCVDHHRYSCFFASGVSTAAMKTGVFGLAGLDFMT